MKAIILGAICAFVLCGILVAGLWPFCHPRNDVTWLESRSGLRFRRPATVLTSGALAMPDSRGDSSCSIEMWVRPARIGDSATLLAFSTPQSPLQLSLRQSGSDLELQDHGKAQPHQSQALFVGRVFRPEKGVLLTVTFGPQGTSTYADGALIETSREFRLGRDECTGQLVIGDSAIEADSWSGDLWGLAIFNQELTAAQVSQRYATWVATGRPEISEDERCVALYAFDERSGKTVHNLVGSGIDLDIPDRYLLLHQTFLKPAWEEFEPSWHYLEDVLTNIAGFVPLGFFFFAYFSSVRRIKRAALATILLGAGVSLTIEVLQAYLPTRFSGTTDLITNTSGTCLGVMMYRCKPVQALLSS